MTTWLACLGDADNPATFGGFPKHILAACHPQGIIDRGLPFNLEAKAIVRKRVLWTFKQMLRGHGRGGYQYSDQFLSDLWATAPAPAANDTIVNIFQLFPQAAFDRIGRRVFYVDQTLHALFHYYGLEKHVPDSVIAEAMAREREQFRAADLALFQSDWAAQDAIARHGLTPDRVGVVLPGPNLDGAAIAAWESQRADQDPVESVSEGPMKLVFVGRDWERKGLDRLINGICIARGRGARIKLDVIGLDRQDVPHKLAEVAGVTWSGKIDKSLDPGAFITRLTSADLGCLLSRAEAGGISLREFARLGMPVLAPNTGGAREYTCDAASYRVAPHDPDEVIADTLVRLDQDRSQLSSSRVAAWAARQTADWSVSADHFQTHMRRLK